MSGSDDAVPRPRERVVLAQRRGARMVRTRMEVQEQTEVGEALVRALIRAQLGLALRLALVVATVVGAVPLLLVAFPALAEASVLGVRLPWLVLGVAVYPVLLVVGRWYIRRAERTEQEFTDLAED
ncbi:hypothetical protein [Rhodococcus sp. NPDC127528]|uniref:hypothetical protein n=1 Tax=unclassified Rhodococcus (in: high G+C Gram-positive bacteria) TaxID=192944 RepID=UPI0036405C38